ncbi:MAG: polymer-forming cytoskeletal protein [Sphingomonadales bacterium]|nr:polymer-forming cytoskeletal protein [Sphingomonadales bacterium]
MSASSSTFSVLGADVVVTGDIASTVDLHIDGKVQGDLKCANFVQGEGSEIKGAITAETARIAGTVEGSIEARDLVIQRSARIAGDVVYQNLTIENGGKVEGKFSHRRNAGERRPEAGAAKTPLELVADQPSRESSQGMAG